MRFWDNPAVMTVLAMAGLLLLASVIRTSIPPLRRLGIPDSMVAGFAGLLLGTSAFAVLPLNVETLEMVVYHGLAVIFIAVGLQQPVQTKGGNGARSVAFALPLFAAIQCLLGLGIAMALSAHPGFGSLLPLGFQQGPGQALSMGEAWESTGLVDGGQVGLIIAAAGFAWSVFVGVPLVAVGRKLGWTAKVDPEAATEETAAEHVTAEPGGLEPFTGQAAIVAVLLLATWGVISFAASVLPEKMAPMAYGFHFIVGLGLAILTRVVLRKLGRQQAVLKDGLLGRIGGSAVDAVTCCALAAVQIGVLKANWVPILLITGIGGGVTVVGLIWLAKRAWNDAPFEHAMVVFGAVTGTLPTGLALLRMVDPDLKGPAASSAVIGSAAAAPLIAPLVIAVFPMPVTAWPDTSGSLIAMGICAAYVVALLVAWRLFGGLRFLRPLPSIWPPDAD
jgi:glutamate:Na+ symporter, ESS family